MPFPCPHCGEKTIPVLRKWFLGPALPTTCKGCDKKVGVPYWSMVVAIPTFILVVVAFIAVEDVALRISLFAAAAVIGTVLQHFVVPLEKR